MNKVTIIGAGSVGATIAYKLASELIATEVVLIDVNNEKALGEAMDIRQGMAFIGKVNVYAGTYEDAVGSDIVIITSGVARKANQTRLDLAKINVSIVMDIIPQISKAAPNAKYIIVSNPVDVITYAFHMYSDLPESSIIGSGTILDTTRLRERIAKHFEINSQNVHAMVFGEHGDSSFVPWSVATISNVPVDEYPSLVIGSQNLIVPVDHDEAENHIKRSGAKVIAQKGATFYAVSLGVCHICRCILNDTKSSLTVSTMMHGEYGVDDVCLSTLCIVGKYGIQGKVLCKLNDEEIAKLRRSGDVLKETIKYVFEV